MKFSMPWSLTVGYGVTMRENTGGRFNTKSMRYPYKFTQNLNFSGNVRISDGGTSVSRADTTLRSTTCP